MNLLNQHKIRLSAMEIINASRSIREDMFTWPPTWTWLAARNSGNNGDVISLYLQIWHSCFIKYGIDSFINTRPPWSRIIFYDKWVRNTSISNKYQVSQKIYNLSLYATISNILDLHNIHFLSNACTWLYWRGNFHCKLLIQPNNDSWFFWCSRYRWCVLDS